MFIKSYDILSLKYNKNKILIFRLLYYIYLRKNFKIKKKKKKKNLLLI